MPCWSLLVGRCCAALLIVLLAGCSSAPAELPTPTAPPATPTVLLSTPTKSEQAEFQRTLDSGAPARAFGAARGQPLFLDGRLTQFFARGRVELSAGAVTSSTLDVGWPATLPNELFTLAGAPQRATLSAPPSAEPLMPISVTLSVPGYSGAAELRLYDSAMRLAGSWPAQISAGSGTLLAEGRGALGAHPALLLIDGRVAGASSALFTLDAQTGIQTGQPRFDDMYPAVRSFMQQDTLSYTLDGVPVHGYRSPDNNLLWLRDHTYQSRGFRYFETDMTSLIDAFRREQQPDGSFPDYLKREPYSSTSQRMEPEADVESLFVQAVYDAWQATGDDTWMRSNLDAMRRGLQYTMSSPLRWDAEHQLVKRPFTIDTWDFQYGPTTADPATGQPAARHWIDGQTIWGIFHGDNTNLGYSLRLLARMEEYLGDTQAAARDRQQAEDLIHRLRALSWNGRFFTHFVPLQPFDVPGVDESEQLSLSNAYALNRSVLETEQGHAIVSEYYRRNQQRGQTFAEWYSIDPPFPAGLFGLAGNPGEQPGEYVNGGIMPLVGGELARGAFRYGLEGYAFDILNRYYFLIHSTGASYLWYYPAGNPGKSSTNTLPTDGWGASAMLGALIEGAAGIEDRSALYHDVVLSPRWSAADDVQQARVVARYAASDGYIAYRWQRQERGLSLDLTGTAEHIQLRLLLPANIKRATQVTLDGAAHSYTIAEVFGSYYLQLDLQQASGSIQVRW